MNNKLVIDSCVFAKIFLEEEESHIAKSLYINACKENKIIMASTIFEYEILAIIRRYNLPFDVLYPIIAEQLKTSINVIHLDQEITRKAYQISKTGNEKSGFPSFYDSTYHALAILNECDFITSDKKHYEKTKHLGNIKLLKNETAKQQFRK